MKRKLMIGLGCSWTQGEGGYTEEIWKQYDYRVNKPMHESVHLIPMENENSWVNVLCKEYFPDHEPINLGQRGIGNRGAAKTLYLTNIDWSQAAGSTVIYLLSGLERFDFFRQHPIDFISLEAEHKFQQSYKATNHYNFNTMWPHHGHGNKLWDAYFEMVYSENQTAMETYSNIMEVQTFCKAHNLKFIFASAFDGRARHFISQGGPNLVDNIDWTSYLHHYVDYESFAQLLVRLDNITEYGGYHEVYYKLNQPAKYLTNCIHPTIDGYKIIAEEISSFINRKNKALIDQ